MADDTARRIEALESAVSMLREELARAREPRLRSMHQTQECAMCGGRRILHFRKIHEMAHGGMVDLALQKEYSNWRGLKRSAGALEAYACRNCRYIEWHAISLDDVKPDGDEVVEIESVERPMDPTPYR